jgi:hypothetical protein
VRPFYGSSGLHVVGPAAAVAAVHRVLHDTADQIAGELRIPSRDKHPDRSVYRKLGVEPPPALITTMLDDVMVGVRIARAGGIIRHGWRRADPGWRIVLQPGPAGWVGGGEEEHHGRFHGLRVR